MVDFEFFASEICRSHFRKQVSSIPWAQAASIDFQSGFTYKILAGDTRYKDLGYKRGDPREQKIQSLMKQLRGMGVDIRYQTHQIIDGKRTFFVDSSGILKN